MDSFDKARWTDAVDLCTPIVFCNIDQEKFMEAVKEMRHNRGGMIISSDAPVARWERIGPPEVACRSCGCAVPLTRTHCGSCGGPREVMK